MTLFLESATGAFAGYAWQYKRYSKDPEYGNLETKARMARLGFWQDKSGAVRILPFNKS